MSERVTKSMYDNFPFDKWGELGKKGRVARKIHRVRERARYWYLKRLLTKQSIAEEKVDFTKLNRYVSSSFPKTGPFPWLDRPDALQRISELESSGKITADRAGLAKQFIQDGYIVLEKFFDDAALDRIWKIYEQRVYNGEVPIETYQKNSGDLFLGRCLNPHFTVPELKELTHDKRLVEILSFLMGVKTVPFQTIMGYAGSQQAAHSDAIHMTTYPLGYLSAAWIAFEDIHPDSGPLVYYPGSHRLPYMLSHDINEGHESKHETWYNDVYEKEVAKLVEEKQLTPKYFLAKKGDVLVWHSNLIHGGSKRNDPQLSRKAMVGHYFGEGAFPYGDRHEIMADPYQG